MKVINYHYICNPGDLTSNYHHISFKNFEKQLDYFDQKYGFISLSEWTSLISGRINEMPKGVVLTFDDGLKGHIQAARILNERKLWGLFYVNSKPYYDYRLLDVHNLHMLLGNYSHKLLEEQYKYNKLIF